MSEDDSRPSPASEPQERRRGWLERLSSAISGEPSNREDLVELLRDTHADGLIDAGEREAILGRAQDAGLDADDLAALRQELAQPLSMPELLALIGQAYGYQQASAALEQTTLLMRNANGLLNNNGKQMFGSAEKAMKSLEQSTATINTLLTNNQEALGDGMQGLNSLAPAIRELRDTLGSLRAISRRLESNPSGYLLGHETDKEFTP